MIQYNFSPGQIFSGAFEMLITVFFKYFTCSNKIISMSISEIIFIAIVKSVVITIQPPLSPYPV